MTKASSFFSYIGTLGAGICIGVLCSHRYFARVESERADREINSMKESMRKKHIDKKAPVDVKKAVEKHDDIPSFRAYRTLSESSILMAEAEHPKEDEYKKPYFIDIDDFDSVTLGYAKKELSYYMDDGTLVDEEENVLSIIDTVGGSNIESFDNSLESCCYIRNEALKEDYEISKVFGSFGNMLSDD